MRVSDERQQKDDKESRMRKRYPQEKPGRKEELSWAKVTAGRGKSPVARQDDYDERKKAREARHREAEEREGRLPPATNDPGREGDAADL